MQALYSTGTSFVNRLGVVTLLAALLSSSATAQFGVSRSVAPFDTLFKVSGNGNVGIGTINPLAKLDIAGGTVSPAGTRAGLSVSHNFAYTALSDDDVFGISSNVIASLNPGGHSLFAAAISAQLGIPSGAVYSASGIRAIVENSSGTIGYATGLLGDVNNSGSVTEAYGVSGYVSNTGSMSKAYGGRFEAYGAVENIGLYAAGNNGARNYAAIFDGSVGIGTNNPTAALHVAGSIKIADGNQAVGRVLTSDASGLAAWQPAPGGVSSSGSTNYLTKFTSSSSIGNSTIFESGGGLGIGTTSLNASEALLLQTNRFAGGVFKSTYAGAAHVLRAEYTGTTAADGYGVYARYQPAPNWGIGGRFEGGYVGVEGRSETNNSSGARVGVSARSSGGNSNYGVNSFADGLSSGATNWGARGEARGAGTGTINYGVAGIAGASSSGASNYGVIGSVFATGVANYGGYFIGDLAHTGALIQVSDSRFKENLAPIESILAKLMELKPYSFEFTSREEYKSMNFAPGKHFGVIAQDIEKVFPELVVDAVNPEHRIESKEKDKRHGTAIKYKGVKYMELIPILISAVQSQQKEIQELQQRLNELSNRK